MENSKTKQDVMLDEFNKASSLLQKSLLYDFEKKLNSDKDYIQDINVYITMEKASNVLANIYYEATLDIKSLESDMASLNKLLQECNLTLADLKLEQNNNLLKVLLVDALIENNGLSFGKQMLAYYEEQGDIRNVLNLCLASLPKEQKITFSHINLAANDIENVCNNALDIIDAYHKNFMEENIMPYVTKNSDSIESTKKSLYLLFKMPEIKFIFKDIRTILLTNIFMFSIHKKEYEPMLKRFRKAIATAAERK